MRISLPKALFVHNIAFLFFFFITPKIYLFEDFGLRGEDIMYPVTFLLFLAVLPRLKQLEFPKLHKAIIAYFAYIFLQGLMLSPFTGAFKYFIVIFFKQLQYFMVFYMLLYTFQSPGLKDKTMRFIALLVSANLLWAAIQIITEQKASYTRQFGQIISAYGIGALGETFPHQAAAIFLFCFLFSYFYKTLKPRKIFMVLSSAAIIMTMSRTTIVALAICALYIFFTDEKIKTIIKKPAMVITIIMTIFLSAYFAENVMRGKNVRSYEALKGRFSEASLSRGFRKRFRHWDQHLITGDYLSYTHINFFTGMGRGYANTADNGWRMSGDSGYLRDFVEIGLIGLFLRLFIFFRAGRYVGFKRYMVVLLPFLSLSVTYEVFLMSKSGLVILLLTAILLTQKNNNFRKLSKCLYNSG